MSLLFNLFPVEVISIFLKVSSSLLSFTRVILFYFSFSFKILIIIWSCKLLLLILCVLINFLSIIWAFDFIFLNSFLPHILNPNFFFLLILSLFKWVWLLILSDCRISYFCFLLLSRLIDLIFPLILWFFVLFFLFGF